MFVEYVKRCRQAHKKWNWNRNLFSSFSLCLTLIYWLIMELTYLWANQKNLWIKKIPHFAKSLLTKYCWLHFSSFTLELEHFDSPQCTISMHCGIQCNEFSCIFQWFFFNRQNALLSSLFTSKTSQAVKMSIPSAPFPHENPITYHMNF